MKNMSGLQLNDITVSRGKVPIIENLSLQVPMGEVTVLLGPNGAGKTTLLEAISGILPTASGTILLDGVEIQALGRVPRSRAGLTHVQQGRDVFPTLTVEENLLVGSMGANVEEGFDLFPELAKRRNVQAGMLSGGEQQMTVLARSILNRPKILLVDEMSLGLAPLIVQRLMPVIRTLADNGVGVLLVEQFAKLALSIGDSAIVLIQGETQFQGECKALIDEPERLQKAYLGAG